MSEQIERDLRSFVTFALAMKPRVTLHRLSDSRGPDLAITFDVEEGDSSAARSHDMNTLLDKYHALKPYLDAIVKSGETLADCAPTIHFRPNVEYKMVRLTGGEFAVAKEAAHYLSRIEDARIVGSDEGEREFAALERFLEDKRDAMVSAFKGLQISNPVASFGAGRVSADGDCTGAVIFVIAEAIICVPVTQEPVAA